MLIDSSSDKIKSCDLVGDQILNHLRKEGLIGDHRNHSAKEKQGLK